MNFNDSAFSEVSSTFKENKKKERRKREKNKRKERRVLFEGTLE